MPSHRLVNEINQRREANWGGDVAMRWERKMMSDRGLPTANEGLSPSTFASAFKMSKCELRFQMESCLNPEGRRGSWCRCEMKE